MRRPFACAGSRKTIISAGFCALRCRFVTPPKDKPAESLAGRNPGNSMIGSRRISGYAVTRICGQRLVGGELV
jgi:hypothetical protein